MSEVLDYPPEFAVNTANTFEGRADTSFTLILVKG